MRTTLLFALALLWATSAYGQQVGDRIVVTAKTVELKVQDKIVRSVPQGRFLTVKQVKADWFWVVNRDGWETTKGWIKRREVLSVEKALEFFNAELRRHPTTEVYTIRGKIWIELKDYDRAVTDLNEAIRLDPKNFYAHYSRGQTWYDLKEFDKAVVDLTAAVDLDPKDADAHRLRGDASYLTGEIERAVADLNEAILLAPSNRSSYRSLAWIHATCSDEQFRDGKLAIKLATKACELSDWKDAVSVTVLAAAYAEAGDFENAVRWQEEFLRLASDSEKKKWGVLLELFKSGRPFRGGRQPTRLGDAGQSSAKHVA